MCTLFTLSRLWCPNPTSAPEIGNLARTEGLLPKESRTTCSSGSQVPSHLRTLYFFSQKYAPGSQNPGLVILEHELSTGSVQAFINAFPLFKQYNWNLKSLATIEGLTPYQNAPDDTSTPTLVPLTAGGNGGAGLIAAPSSSSTSTPPSPTSTPTSADASTASASPASGAKQNGVAPGLRSSSLAGLLSLGLAVVSSLCLI